MICVLTGGTGGAKLARGMTAVLDPERVCVIADSTKRISLTHPTPAVSGWSQAVKCSLCDKTDLIAAETRPVPQ